MEYRFSDRVSSLKPSAIREIFKYENKIECKRIQQAPGRVPLVCVGCFLVCITGGTVTQLYIEEDTVKTENVF